MIPEGSKGQMDAFNNVMKVATSAKNALRIQTTNDQIDISDLLPLIDVPTIIFHSIDDARVPISESKFMAANIKNSRFVPLKGKNHVLLETDKDWKLFKDEVTKFLND